MWLRGETDVRTPESIISLANIQRSSTAASQSALFPSSHITSLTLVRNLRFPVSTGASVGDSWSCICFLMPVIQSAALELLHFHFSPRAVEYLGFTFRFFRRWLLFLRYLCLAFCSPCMLHATPPLSLHQYCSFFFVSMSTDSLVSVCVPFACSLLNPHQYHSINNPLFLCILSHVAHLPSLQASPSL